MFNTADGQAWWTRPFNASAPAPRFMPARVFGVTRTERALVSAYAASTAAAAAKPMRSIRSMPPIFPVSAGREK